MKHRPYGPANTENGGFSGQLAGIPQNQLAGGRRFSKGVIDNSVTEYKTNFRTRRKLHREARRKKLNAKEA